MFIVKGIETGKCVACERDTECYVVENQRHGIAGRLCLQDFRKQVKIATAASPHPAHGGDMVASAESRGQDPTS